jgi:hypothetical protein
MAIAGGYGGLKCPNGCPESDVRRIALDVMGLSVGEAPAADEREEPLPSWRIPPRCGWRGNGAPDLPCRCSEGRSCDERRRRGVISRLAYRLLRCLTPSCGLCVHVACAHHPPGALGVWRYAACTAWRPAEPEVRRSSRLSVGSVV